MSGQPLAPRAVKDCRKQRAQELHPGLHRLSAAAPASDVAAGARGARPVVKAPIGKSIKDVIDHLRASGQPQTVRDYGYDQG